MLAIGLLKPSHISGGYAGDAGPSVSDKDKGCVCKNSLERRPSGQVSRVYLQDFTINFRGAIGRRTLLVQKPGYWLKRMEATCPAASSASSVCFLRQKLMV